MSGNMARTLEHLRHTAKKHPSLIPLWVVLSITALGTAAQAANGLRKVDVTLNRRQKLPPWERMDLENPSRQKYLYMGGDNKAHPMLLELKKSGI